MERRDGIRLLLVVPGLFVFARWSLAVPVLVNEAGVGLGLTRSSELVRGRSWTVLRAMLPPMLAIVLAGLGEWLLGGVAWDIIGTATYVVFLSYSTVVSIVLYRWFVRVGEEADEPSLAWGSA